MFTYSQMIVTHKIFDERNIRERNHIKMFLTVKIGIVLVLLCLLVMWYLCDSVDAK